MPIVTPNHVYIHLPKTGGSWTGNYLNRTQKGRQIAGGHHPLRVLSPDYLEGKTVFGTIRDPWSWYVSWFRHVNVVNRCRTRLASMLNGPVEFENVLKHMTHPETIQEINPHFGCLWQFPDGEDLAAHAQSWKDSGQGLYSWMVKYMFGDDAILQLDCLVDRNAMYDGMGELLGSPVDREKWKPENVTRRSRPHSLKYVVDDPWTPDMVEWVRKADAEVIELMGYTEPGVAARAPVVWLGRTQPVPAPPPPPGADGTMLEVTDSTFDTEVLDSDLPVLVDFWAPWCRPCKVVLPFVERLAQQHIGNLKVVKVNIEAESQVANDLNIRNIPAFFVFKGGEVVGEKFGAAGGLKALMDLVEPHL